MGEYPENLPSGQVPVSSVSRGWSCYSAQRKTALSGKVWQKTKQEGTEMSSEINQITQAVIGAAIEVHRDLGPGLLESAYQRALEHELTLRGVRFVAQKVCAVAYKGLVIDDAYRIDLLVEEQVVVELKAVDALADVHEAQVLTYLKFSECRVGLLINFRARMLKDGLRRLAL